MIGSSVLRAGVALALGLALTACGGAAVRNAPSSGASSSAAVKPDTGPHPTGAIKVAMLVPLTGEFADIGQQLVNAATVAVFEDKQQRFELIPIDTKGTPQGASAAATSALSERVDMVMGPLFGKHVPAVRQALGASNLAVLTFTNDNQQAGGNVFVMGVTVDGQVEKLASLLAQKNRGRIVVLGPDTPYTQRAIATVREMSGRGGVQLVRSGTYPEGSDYNGIASRVKAVTAYERRRAAWRSYENKLVSQLRAASDPGSFLSQEAARFGSGSIRNRMLRGMATVYRSNSGRGRNAALAEVISRIEGVDAMPADDFDAVLMPFADSSLVAVGSMLDLYNAGHPFAQLAGTNFWELQDLRREPSFHEGWYSSLDQASLQPYELSYRTTYQTEPNPLAVLGYYGVRVAMSAAGRNIRPVTPEFVRRPEGFDGSAGPFSFGADNQMRHPLKVYRITPSGPREVDGQVGPTS